MFSSNPGRARVASHSSMASRTCSDLLRPPYSACSGVKATATTGAIGSVLPVASIPSMARSGLLQLLPGALRARRPVPAELARRLAESDRPTAAA
jgi:hypothetical protein